MNVTIKRVGIGSAFKVGFVLSVLIFAIFGLIGLGFQVLFSSAISSVFQNYSQNYGTSTNFNFSAASLPVFCIAYLVGIVVSGFAGGIGAAIYALFYNLTSGMTGGLQVQLSRETQ